MSNYEDISLPFIIENTEIKFFLLGEWQYIDYGYTERTLLIRSKCTKLELIGQYLSKNIISTKSCKNSGYLTIFIKSIYELIGKEYSPNNNIINTVKFSLLSFDTNRKIFYEFCWKGVSSIDKYERIELENFWEINGRKIRISLRDSHLGELENYLAPARYFCTVVNNKKKSTKTRITFLRLILLMVYFILVSMFIVPPGRTREAIKVS